MCRPNPLFTLLTAACAAYSGSVLADVPHGVKAHPALHALALNAQQPYGLSELADTDRRAAPEEAGPYEIPASGAKYQDYIEQAAREHEVDPALIHAIIRTESRYQAAAVSPKGAIGLMQVMPQTAARFGKIDLFDPAQNIRVGTRYLRTLQQLFNHELPLVLAAYNAGEHAVIRYGYRIPPYPETQNYISAVTSHYRRSRPPAGACAAPCANRNPVASSQ